jgi:hypothetical protein
MATGHVSAKALPRIVTNEPQNLVSVTIHGVTTNALVDSGASLSLASSTFYDRLRNQRKAKSLKTSLYNQQLITADSKPMHISTALETDICIAGLNIPVSLIVIDNLCHPIILGMDFLNDEKADIQLTNKTLSLYNGMLTVPLIRRTQGPAVYTVGNVVLPPNSQSIFAVQTKTQTPAGVYEIEQHARIPNQQVLVAHSIVQPNDKRTVCCVWNPTDKNNKISKKHPDWHINVSRNDRAK